MSTISHVSSRAMLVQQLQLEACLWNFRFMPCQALFLGAGDVGFGLSGMKMIAAAHQRVTSMSFVPSGDQAMLPHGSSWISRVHVARMAMKTRTVI